MSRANPIDEGLIHAWIEGQLSPNESARVERLVATDAEWGAAAAEARGLIAASSRALRALDDVPSVVRDGMSSTSGTTSMSGTISTSGTSGTRSRVWRRSAWVRAAAGVVLVAGVSSAVWMRGDFSAEPAIDAVAKQGADQAANATAPIVTAAPVPSVLDSQAKASVGDSQRAAASPRALNEKEAVSALQERKEASGTAGQRALVPAPASAPVARPAATPPPAVEQGVVAAKTVTTDSIRASGARAEANSRAGAVGGVSNPPGDSGSAARLAGGRGGGRGVAGVGSGAQANAAMELSAKTISASPGVDARLAGCWVPVNPLTRGAEERDRPADVVREPAVALRFIEGVRTDAPIPAPAAPTRQALAQSSTATRVSAPPVTALTSGFASRTVVNATVVPAARPDSAFTAEWIDQRGRNIATFTVRGDTLRGTSRTLPADSARAGAPFVAARVGCQ